MKKVFIFVSVACALSACLQMPSSHSYESDEEIAARRAEVQALEDQDYARERKKRRDMIEDIGEAQMNEAKAINKAYENRSKKDTYIIR